MATLPSKVVVMFVQSLTISKVLIEASFEGADKSVLKYKNMNWYSSTWQRAYITNVLHHQTSSKASEYYCYCNKYRADFRSQRDSGIGLWNKIITQNDLCRLNIGIYVPRGTWGSLNSHSLKSSCVKSGRVWITLFFVFWPFSVLATSIISEIYLQ